MNPGYLRKKRIRLPDISKIGIGDPSTTLKGNFMECTWNIHPISMVNGLKKNIGRDKSTKGAGPREQGMVKTQLEIMEVEKS